MEYNNKCPECQSTFETNKTNQKFCSSECRISYNNKKIYTGIKRSIERSDLKTILEDSIVEFIDSIVDEHYSTQNSKEAYGTELAIRFQEIYNRNKRG